MQQSPAGFYNPAALPSYDPHGRISGRPFDICAQYPVVEGVRDLHVQARKRTQFPNIALGHQSGDVVPVDRYAVALQLAHQPAFGAVTFEHRNPLIDGMAVAHRVTHDHGGGFLVVDEAERVGGIAEADVGVAADAQHLADPAGVQVRVAVELPEICREEAEVKRVAFDPVPDFPAGVACLSQQAGRRFGGRDEHMHFAEPVEFAFAVAASAGLRD